MNRHQRAASRRLTAAAAAVGALVAASAAQAVGIETDNSDLKIRWDNSVKYSASFRLKDRSPTLIADPNQDDGDRNFNTGLVSNRVDLLSEFDLSYKGQLGFRTSAAGWYDSVYRGSNDNDSPATFNNTSVANDQFGHRTRQLHGGTGEFLDAFAFANGQLGEVAGNLRLGRHTLLYGESLFFGSNGIANGQAPLDVVKLLTVPNSQFKEIVRPINQLSGQLQLQDNLTVGAYYQFEWKRTLIPSAGSYLSGADVLEGSERFLLPSSLVPVPGAALVRQDDLKPGDSGQSGLQIKWRPKAVDAEFGFYAIQYHDKSPQFYLYPGANVDPTKLKFGEYRLVYPGQPIRSYGVSVSTQIGDVNVSGEVSVRRNTPLVSDPQFVAPTADNQDNAAYAIGNSAHVQVSALYIVPPTALWNSAVFMGEVAWNRRTSVTKNEAALAANSSRDAWAARVVFTPTWYQAVGLLDLSMPVGVGYSAKGNSSVVGQFNPGGKDGGDLSVGVQGVYQQVWRFGLNLTHFFGSEGTALNTAGQYSFKQYLKDRDFVSLSVQRTF